MNMQPILSICIPTYNRKDTVVRDVYNYLSLKDERFCVIISDNGSEDGTVEALNEIDDKRLCVISNKVNIGGPNNVMKVLYSAQTEYAMLVLDKDGIDINYLGVLIDSLLQEKPEWGVVNLACRKIAEPEKCAHGMMAMAYTSGFAPKHPSGFFVRSSIFSKMRNESWRESVSKDFKFPLEAYELVLAIRYDMLLINIPLVVDSNIRKTNETPSYTYNQSNCWFFYEARAEYYKTFMKIICKMDIDQQYKKKLVNKLTRVNVSAVSKTLRRWMHSEEFCKHYHLIMRNVSVLEMVENITKLLRIYREVGKPHDVYSTIDHMVLWCGGVSRSIKMAVKEQMQGYEKVKNRIGGVQGGKE